MSEETEYAIGNADRIGIVVSDGVVWAEYDLQQAQDEQHAKYRLDGKSVLADSETIRETGNLGIGDVVAFEIVEDVMDSVGSGTVRGFVVPDHLLATFDSKYPDKRLFRQQ